MGLINYVFVILELVIIIGIVARLLYNYCSEEKREEAVVVNKQSFDKTIYRKNQAPFVKKLYVITFQCKNNKRHFYVSELSYNNYRINQKGTIKYKGNRLIDFT